MSAKYVRDYYNVDFKRGDRVITQFDHLPPDRQQSGVVVSFPNQYVGVRFDGEKHTARVHPRDLMYEELTHSDSRKAGEGTICRNDRSCERANRAALPWPWSI